MSLDPITNVVGTGVHLPGDDIDTDRIIPARFMKCITFDGLGEYAFYDERKKDDGSDKAHPLNESPWNKASVLLSGSNFGCGSSREHAPQSLYHWGFRAVIAESFAEIFFGNATTLGMPCVCASTAAIQSLAEVIAKAPESEIKIDLDGMTASCADKTIEITMPAGARDALMNGRWDAIAELLETKTAVDSIAQNLHYNYAS